MHKRLYVYIPVAWTLAENFFLLSVTTQMPPTTKGSLINPLGTTDKESFSSGQDTSTKSSPVNICANKYL